MKVIIKATPKEIAALVLAVQGRQENNIENPEVIIREAVQKAIDGIAQEGRAAL